MTVLLDMFCTILVPLSVAVHHHWSTASGFVMGVLQRKFLFAWQIDQTAIFTSYFTLDISSRYFSELLFLVPDQIYQQKFLEIDSRHRKITHWKMFLWAIILENTILAIVTIPPCVTDRFTLLINHYRKSSANKLRVKSTTSATSKK